MITSQANPAGSVDVVSDNIIDSGNIDSGWVGGGCVTLD